MAEAELLLFVNRAVQLIKICICEKFKIRRKDKQTNNKQNKKKTLSLRLSQMGKDRVIMVRDSEQYPEGG